VCCMCDPFLTSVRLRCFQEMYKKMELQTFTVYRWYRYPGIQFFLFHFSLLTFHLGDWWDYSTHVYKKSTVSLLFPLPGTWLA